MLQKNDRLARVEDGPYGEYLRAARRILAGEPVFFLDGKFASIASKHSIQFGRNRHVVTDTAIWRFTNHACVPNMRIDPKSQSMVATRDIEAGEELNFNYNTSEWSISSPFACGCAAPDCAGEVRGFRYLSDDRRESLRSYLTPYLLDRWEEEEKTNFSRRQGVHTLKPEVQVLIAYERDGGELVSPEYDTQTFRKELSQWFEPLGLSWRWIRVAPDNIEEVVAELVKKRSQQPIVILNLCDGSEADGYPGASIIHALDAAGLPFSGASEEFYTKTTSKLASKMAFEASGVSTAPMVLVEDVEQDIDRAIESLGTPFIIKPDISAGSYGIQIDSVCHDRDSAIAKILELKQDRYIGQCDIYVERFVDGREFTVFAVEDDNQPLGLRILVPCERAFDRRLPPEERFIIYERHWDLPEKQRSLPAGTPYCVHLPVEDGELREQLATLVRRAVRAVSGTGYARCDVRQDARTGQLYVLEVNAQCDLSSDPKSEIGSILKFSGMEMPELIEMILDHALVRQG